MDTGLLKLVRTLTDREKIKPNKRLTAFLICLFVSAMFWFLNSLSHKYTETISLPVSYINIPKEKFLVNKLPEKILLKITAQGFYLFANKINLFNDQVIIDCNNLKYKNESSQAIYPTYSGFDKIASQLNSEVEILKIFPDTIFFYFGDKKAKVVPVKFNSNVSFEKQYQLKGEIKLNPNRVTVLGPGFLVDSIKEIETELVILKELKKDASIKANLILPIKYKEFELSQSQIQVSLSVEKFTEAFIEVPVNTINLPDNYSIKTFPEKIKISYLVAFSEFDHVDASKFTVIADYNKINNQNRIAIEIKNKPEFVQIIRTNPSKVEYIISKR